MRKTWLLASERNDDGHDDQRSAAPTYGCIPAPTHMNQTTGQRHAEDGLQPLDSAVLQQRGIQTLQDWSCTLPLI